MVSKPLIDHTWEFRPGSPKPPEQHLACQETQRGCRQTSGWLRGILSRPFLAILTVLVLAGCAPTSSALVLMPVTGAVDTGTVDTAGPSAALEVREYVLVEQSTDNPTHLAFQQRVPEAVATQRGGWSKKADEDLAAFNRALAPFDFHLQASSIAPFGGYTLYHYETPIQSDIARVWPVSLRQGSGAGGDDFILPFVTLSGEKRIASISGVQPWPGETASGANEDAPAYIQGQLAYAQTHDGRVSVYAGPSLLYDAPDPASESASLGQDARSLLTWSGVDEGQHWGLQLDGHAVVDGQNLNQSAGYDEVFGLRVIDDQPLYFFTRGGITQVYYSDHALPYQYDQVVHGNTGELAVYNPGSAGRVVWFYALRDGLWYYVEIGKFE